MVDWYFITRFGNSLLLLPVAAAIVVGLWMGGRFQQAVRFGACFAAAVLLVLVTKVAFLGWGIGSRVLDFTGISGHSTLAAAVLPVLGWWLTQERGSAVRGAAITGFSAAALAVGWSRLVLDAHSVSEVVFGLLLGFGVAWVVVPWGSPTHGRSWLARLVALALLTGGAVPVQREFAGAHGLVVQIALTLSGRSEVFTRDML